MSRRTDAIVTVCVLLSLFIAVMSVPIYLFAGAACACLAFCAACYLVILAMFVVLYVGGGDG